MMTCKVLIGKKGSRPPPRVSNTSRQAKEEAIKKKWILKLTPSIVERSFRLYLVFRQIRRLHG